MDLECRVLRQPPIDFRHRPLGTGGSELFQPEPFARGSATPISQWQVPRHHSQRICAERGCHDDAFVRAPTPSHAPAQVGALGHDRWIWCIDSHVRRRSAAAGGEGNARKNLATAGIDVPPIVRCDVLALWSRPPTPTLVYGTAGAPCWNTGRLVDLASGLSFCLSRRVCPVSRQRVFGGASSLRRNTTCRNPWRREMDRHILWEILWQWRAFAAS